MSSVGTVIVTPPAPAGEQDPPPAEVVAAIESSAEASVSVAEVQAERDVAIAEIQAEVAETAIEAATDDRILSLEQELAICRTNIATLQSENQTLTAELLTRPAAPPPPPPPEPPEPEGERRTEPPGEPEAPPEAPPKPKKKLGWI